MTADPRPDPDALLQAIQKEEARRRRGKLKVFLGMSAGVGKTYAMLEAAQKEKKAGRDLVIGHVETHGRVETERLTEGLPVVPSRRLAYRGIELAEMDLDAVLARRPSLALVDELAHTNVPGSRHTKRYQDVLELLEAGIDVYTTLNVQHVASRADAVRQITGAIVQEVVPDTVLDAADIELIDIPPDELLARLDAGKVYLPDRAEAALFNFFREGNLTALREMALRLTAERVGQDVRDYMQAMQIAGPWKSGHRLLVAVSASPYSEQLIRWTRRFTDGLNCPWIALYVESARALGEADEARLAKNLAVARELGAEVITTTDEDVVRGVLRVARQHNVTQIVAGKTAEHPWREFLRGGSLLRRLVRESGDIDIHIVRAERTETASGRSPERRWREPAGRQYWVALGVVGAVGVVNALLDSILGYRALALNFLLAVAGLALVVGRGPVLAAATVSALIWNFFFLPPRFTFFISSIEDAMMFGMYFVLALVLGQLIARIRSQERAERQREERATALYLLTRELAQAADLDALVRCVVRHVGAAFQAPVAVLVRDASGRLAESAQPGSSWGVSAKEQSVAAWVFQHGRAAGKFTDNLPSSEAIHLPLATGNGAVGVLAVALSQESAPTLHQRNLLDALTGQVALALDRQRLQEASEQSKLLAESERLGKALLNSISHEVRTPLAAITGAVQALREAAMPARPEVQGNLLREIEEGAARLNRLVGNLLEMTRLESGHLKPKLEWCDVADLINVTQRELGSQLARHAVIVTAPDRLPLVQMDFVLMQQALSNLLINAAMYTPPGTVVEIGARAEGKEMILTVADHGPGLPPEAVSRVFDKFYRGPGAPTGGTGLGLSIAKGFVESQGGRIEAGNRPSGGALFTLRLPLGDMPAIQLETATA